MNKGIAHSTGDLIGILNSDDIFYSCQVLEKIANFHLNHSVDASIGDIVQLRKNGKVFRTYSSATWTVDKLRYGYMPPHPSIFVKREIFKRFGVYSLDFEIASDFELLVRLFYVNKISWKYSNLITTSMQLGGLSSSGFVSYKIITAEMRKALLNNRVRFSSFFIYLRFLGKIQELWYGKSSPL
jgi:glycosyltransferase involved in cell wall biosynthesis